MKVTMVLLSRDREGKEHKIELSGDVENTIANLHTLWNTERSVNEWGAGIRMHIEVTEKPTTPEPTNSQF